jgi:hypothetical protein
MAHMTYRATSRANRDLFWLEPDFEFELRIGFELIQTQMGQKSLLWVEVGAHASWCAFLLYGLVVLVRVRAGYVKGVNKK